MKNRWVFALSISVMWGIVFANALHDATTGICMGLLMGMAFGLFGFAGGSKDAGESKESSEGSE